MNEIQLIRSQLGTERQRASEVAKGCAGALRRASAGWPAGGAPIREFQQACVEYLVCVLAWFEERDQRLGDFARSLPGPADATRRALEEALARPGRSHEALEKLAAAVAASGAGSVADSQRGWREFAEYFNRSWSARRDALDELLAASSRVTDWRAVAGIDADSILEERQRYARVCAASPADVTLSAAPRQGS